MCEQIAASITTWNSGRVSSRAWRAPRMIGRSPERRSGVFAPPSAASMARLRAASRWALEKPRQEPGLTHFEQFCSSRSILGSDTLLLFIWLHRTLSETKYFNIYDDCG